MVPTCGVEPPPPAFQAGALIRTCSVGSERREPLAAGAHGVVATLLRLLVEALQLRVAPRLVGRPGHDVPARPRAKESANQSFQHWSSSRFQYRYDRQGSGVCRRPSETRKIGGPAFGPLPDGSRRQIRTDIFLINSQALDQLS